MKFLGYKTDVQLRDFLESDGLTEEQLLDESKIETIEPMSKK
jgi:hypothetical protein